MVGTGKSFIYDIIGRHTLYFLAMDEETQGSEQSRENPQ